MSLKIDAVIVTGAGRGIGKAIAHQLADHGIPVLCISKSENANKTRDEIIAKGGSAFSIVHDLCDFDYIETEVSKWLSQSSHRRVGLVLAAGILGPTGPIHETDLNTWNDIFSVNLLGNLAVYKGAAKHMLQNQYGRIVLFSGGGSAYAFPEFPAYSASKTAVVRTVENIHEDLKDKGNFAVVCIAPGAVETDMLQDVRAAGAAIKSTTDISLPVNFVEEFLDSTQCVFSGCFIHVKDVWKEYLNNAEPVGAESMWKLRRIEQ